MKKIITLINTQLNKLSGNEPKHDLSSYSPVLTEIRQAHDSMGIKTDDELKCSALELKKKGINGHLISSLLPEVYALTKEVFKRKLQISPYEVQLIGAIALNERNIIEMNTGEGKTLTAVFPAILNALSGKGVHILTFNDYLAKRDADWMRPIYDFFELSVGYVGENRANKEKIAAYNADITYGTAKAVGFDYLRSCMAYCPEELILRDFHFAIIDEADSILIDEARNPLVLAGVTEKSDIDHYEIAQFVSSLVNELDFSLDENSRNVNLTNEGIEKAEKHYQLINLYEDKNKRFHSAINLALQAKVLLHKDIDYVIKGLRIMLVDELTGRIIEDRKWQNGLQTAVEAKELLPIQSEGNILNSISVQHLVNLYTKLAGMTGTAQQARQEFSDIYNLRVLVIPPNRPCRRTDYEDLVFSGKKTKTAALIQEIKTLHSLRRPILIGTLTVRESEELQKELLKHQIQCRVLNAKNDEMEADIISDAGRLDAITISTNMAGRGTDILLGGNDEKERAQVISLGGLHIIGTNRHENIRIDHQLRGRAGRQGDPGSTHFIISLEDDLMVRYQLNKLLPIKLRDVAQDNILKKKAFHSSIAQAQRIISAQMSDIRKTLFAYSSFIELQRKIIVSRRKKAYFFIEAPSLILEIKNDRNDKVRNLILNQYDFQWALHLNFIAQLREGIHWERIGGNDPFRVFLDKADGHFQQIISTIETNIKKIPDYNEYPDSLDIKKPSSTWTYIVNDNPFKNQLGLFLGESGNIGFQIDGISAPLLFILALIRRWGWKTKS